MNTSISINDQDLQVAKFLEDNSFKYDVTYMLDCSNDPEWQHDLFNIIISDKNGNRIVTEFKTGLGHRVLKRKVRQVTSLATIYNKELDKIGLKGLLTEIKTPFTLSDGFKKTRYMENSCYAIPPTQASVLFSLLMDADWGDYSFSDFCECLGYEEDSMKAFEIYKACQKNKKQLEKVFTYKQLGSLKEMLEDY